MHFEIISKDGKLAQKFYQSLFRWKINANNPMNYGLVDTGTKIGIKGDLDQLESGGHPFSTFYVAVDDPRKYLDKVVTLGGKVIVPVTWIVILSVWLRTKCRHKKPVERKQRKVKNATENKSPEALGMDSYNKHKQLFSYPGW